MSHLVTTDDADAGDSVADAEPLPAFLVDADGSDVRESSDNNAAEGFYRYMDFSHIDNENPEGDGPTPDPENLPTDSSTIPNHDSSNPIRTQKFPVKLYAILQQPQFEKIITWMPHGRSWKILDRNLFRNVVMPLYFENNNQHSFNRLVCAWSFRRFSSGPDRGSYFHELFIRGKPHLQKYMRRLPKAHKKLPMRRQDEPDFYRLDQLQRSAASHPEQAFSHVPERASSSIIPGAMEARSRKRSYPNPSRHSQLLTLPEQDNPPAAASLVALFSSDSPDSSNDTLQDQGCSTRMPSRLFETTAAPNYPPDMSAPAALTNNMAGQTAAAPFGPSSFGLDPRGISSFRGNSNAPHLEQYDRSASCYWQPSSFTPQHTNNTHVPSYQPGGGVNQHQNHLLPFNNSMNMSHSMNANNFLELKNAQSFNNHLPMQQHYQQHQQHMNDLAFNSNFLPPMRGGMPPQQFINSSSSSGTRPATGQHLLSSSFSSSIPLSWQERTSGGDLGNTPADLLEPTSFDFDSTSDFARRLPAEEEPTEATTRNDPCNDEEELSESKLPSREA